jgi:hypothetical protein
MNETLKRLLFFLGILVVGIVFYIYRSPHKTPREKMGALAGAKPYSKAASEGDLKSLPPGKYICTVLNISGQVPVSTSCEAVQNMDPEERRNLCRD